ncbi:sodium/calcium exchanger regulatory protein 1 [Folsomia candida]|uniref:Fatty acid-binding protein, muscle n=1 Tax=Folsomia candida TaxID=158441 RepID=A0A226F576_FOLCA|nr:sodium/calcium exchanger regulatory protein 1 [Folsomia candida]OXA64972.1 Fatty acid-binding protein, adipocyte [Folsomia candida]
MKLFVVIFVSIFLPHGFSDDTSNAATTGTPVSIVGRYELSSSDKFYEYMTALGVGFFTKNLAAAATPIATISKEGDLWTIKTETTFKTTTITFKLGEEFDETTGDDRTCKTTITMDGTTKMLTNQVCSGKAYRIDREFSPTQMTMKLYADSVTSTRIYRRL